MITEFEQVVLVEDVPAHHLKAGDVGTVVDITPNKKQLTLEFFNFEGDTIAVVPITPSQIRPVRSDEIMHARQVA
jgi:hypothetical protein